MKSIIKVTYFPQGSIEGITFQSIPMEDDFEDVKNLVKELFINERPSLTFPIQNEQFGNKSISISSNIINNSVIEVIECEEN